VLVLGAGGFLGRHLVEELGRAGHRAAAAPRAVDAESAEAVEGAFREAGAEALINAAGFNGGVKFNELYPAEIFRRSSAIALGALEGARRAGARRVLSFVASCAYSPQVCYCVGSRFFSGEPHPTVACHGEAKRLLQRASNYYRQQYGLDAVCLCPPTLYGPGDRTDPVRAKFPMAMAMRMVQARRAGLEKVSCWGDGSPLREVMHVRDCARLAVGFLEKEWDRPYPFNLPSGQEPNIRNFAHMAAHAAGYRGGITWQGGPAAQDRKRLYNDEMDDYFPGFSPIPLEEGIREMVAWYEEQR
jgi:GDP-L-fucose synthase